MHPRHLAASIREALRDTPVIFLNGARQTGKTTLARSLSGGAYFTLDDATIRAAAAADADGFVAALAGKPGPVVIDELQHVPALLPALKAAVDRDRRPGRFLLTGSADVLLLPGASESLAGRMEIFTLQPLSQGEIAGRRETFLANALAVKWRAPRATGESREALLHRLTLGGFPEALTRKSEGRRDAWFAAYAQAIVQRDIRELSGIEGLAQMPQLLTLLALRSGSLLNRAEIARSLALPHSTLQRYLALFELTFLFQPLPAWAVNRGKRLVRASKVHLCDSGLAASLCGLSAAGLAFDPVRAGGLLESFVLGELRKQAGWHDARPKLFHFRTPAGREVDIVLEDRAGAVIGIEVKAAATVGASDFSGLKELALAAGKKWRRGIILYGGRQTVPFAPDLHAVPLPALWADD